MNISPYFSIEKTLKKSWQVGVALLYRRYKWVPVMDGVKFGLNDIISKYLQNEDGQSTYDIILSIFL